jgi:tight adherence protein C
VSPTFLLAAGVCAIGLSIALFVVALAPARGTSSEISRALQAIQDRYSQRNDTDDDAGQVPASPGWLRWLGQRLSAAGSAAAIQRRLDMAGNPPRWNADRVYAAKAAGMLLLGALGGLIGLKIPAMAVFTIGAGAVAGLFLPDLLLYNNGIKRQAQIQNALPDSMDMLTVCVEAGLGFDAAMARVTQNTSGPLAAEFARALQEMQIGKSRTEALRALAARTTVAELRAFVSALVQAGDLGIPVADVLREQAREMRLNRRQRAEEKAQQVPVKILFPLIGCLFPALFVIVIGPGALSILHSMFGHHP